MLDPDYILRLSEGAEEIASQLHIGIIRRVIRRVMLRLQRKDDYLLTAIDKWQLETLQEAGFLREELVEEIAKATGRQVSEIKRAFEAAGVKTVAWDNAVYKAAGLSPDPLLNSPTLLSLLDRGYRKTMKEWRNYTGTTATAAQQLFIQVCDQAYTQVATGSISYTQAVKEAVEKVARSGVVVHYPSGWWDTIETATLRAVRTGVAQACADMTEARMEELDWDTVLTSAHLGARYGDGGENFTNHYWWQGKFYSRSGKDPRFPPLSVCGQGEVQGLCGPNCRHSIGPGDGVNNPFERFNSEENRKRYDLEEHQRSMERRLRNTKRQVQGLKEAVDNADEATKPELERLYQKKARLLQKQNEDYNRFCAENDLKPLQDRLKIAGWDRKQAASATAAARKGAIYDEERHTSWLKEINAQTTTLSTLDKYQEAKYNNTPEYQLLRGYAKAVKQGEISPLVGFDQFTEVNDAISQQIVGQTTSTGVAIESAAPHFVARVIGQVSTSHNEMRLGVPIADALDALMNPVKVDKVRVLLDGDIRQTFKGRMATVAVSIRDKRLIQTNPRR